MISLVVILEVSPNRLDEFISYVREQSTASCLEPGCRRFEVSQKLDQENVFTLAELYDDQAALDAHLVSPHFLQWRERVSDGLILSKTSVRGQVIQ